MEDVKSLITKAKTGDKDAFSQLYELTKDKAYFIAARYVGAEDAADVLQESYISALRSITAFDENEPIEPWLHTIVRNRAIDFIRRRKPVGSLDADEFPEVEDSEALLPEEYLEREDVRRTILRIIDNLPDAQRLTVVMRYFEGKTNDEIAELMGCSINTVGSRLRYAKNAIREAVLMEEERGNKLYGIVPVPFLTKLFKLEMESGVHHIPEAISEQVSSAITDSLAAGSTAAGTSAEGAVTSSATAGGTSAGSTTMGAGVLGKIAVLSVGAKAVIATVCVIAVVAGVGVPLYLRSENQKAIQAALVLQQQQEEQSRLEAESLAAQQEAERAEYERAEAERLETERLEAERLVAERLEAERLEAERLEAERLEAEQSEAEQSEISQQEVTQSEASQQEVSQPEVSQKETPPSAVTSSVILNDKFGNVTISDVFSSEKRTLDFMGYTRTLTVYYVSATCKIAFNETGADLTAFEKISEDTYHWLTYIYIGDGSSPVSLSRDYDLYIITQDIGAELVYHGVIIVS